MQEGSFRCDANVSVRKAGDAKLGTRCEIKNLNSFRFMEQAIEFEARRQIGILEDGGAIAQETRLYDPDRGETRSMRSKEDAQDYRYFPDPDLLPLVVDEPTLARIRAGMPELPAQREERYRRDLGIAAASAAVLVGDKDLSDYFERAIAGAGAEVVRHAANWVVSTTTANLHERGKAIADAPAPERLRALMERIADGTISGKIAKEVDDAMWAGEGAPDEIIARRGLKQISDAGALESIVDDVLAKNPKLAEDYRAGKDKAFNALVGQVMKATQGKANPAQANEILKRRLAR
jgi:aspartyl-tRNA(Asn)/glutamyl-tRNA(Gln) amidotransferase subunit B